MTGSRRANDDAVEHAVAAAAVASFSKGQEDEEDNDEARSTHQVDEGQPSMEVTDESH
jgi:hypothetical protein